MSNICHLERATQNRVISLFHDELGCHTLGDWTYRPGNSNITKGLPPPTKLDAAIAQYRDIVGSCGTHVNRWHTFHLGGKMSQENFIR